MKLTVIVGTVSETALDVAQTLAAQWQPHFAHIVVQVADEQTSGAQLELGPDEVALFCVSTYNCGDLPDNIQPLYFDLDFEPRYLGALRYGLIALGDSGFADTFAMGGRQMDARLQDLGAQRLVDVLVLDACDDEAQRAAQLAQWSNQWLQTVGQLPQ